MLRARRMLRAGGRARGRERRQGAAGARGALPEGAGPGRP